MWRLKKQNHCLFQQYSPCQEPKESETRFKNWATEGEGERKEGGSGRGGKVGKRKGRGKKKRLEQKVKREEKQGKEVEGEREVGER